MRTAPELDVELGPSLGLIDLIKTISCARALEEITAAVSSGVRALLGADGVTFVLRDGDLCHYADEEAISPLWKGQRFPMETCISGWAMLHREPAVIEDIYADPRIPHDAYRLTFVKSLVMVPVRREAPVAAIGAYWARHRRPSPVEIGLLDAVANSAAVAIANLTLIGSLERMAAEAQAANDQKSRFLAACSHDLRQPFQAMRLYQSVLETRVGDREPEALRRLGEALTHGEELLAGLLDVSTIDSGLVVVSPRPTSLNDVLARLDATFMAQAQEKGLRLTIAPTRRCAVTDPVLLTQILTNLLGNAIKFTARGRIVVGARPAPGGGVAVQVWDSGPGIAADQIPRIFEDCYQIGNQARDKRMGIGLGLGIVARLAKLLGHRIDVRSRPGKGSVFSVVIPATQ